MDLFINLRDSGKTRIIVNLLPPKSGGGLQNAVSFIYGLASLPELRDSSVVACVENGDVHRACQKNGILCEIYPAGRFGRLHFELIGGASMARRYNANLVFTLFGNAPLFSPNLYKISGFALSNILMSEVPFWVDVPFPRKWAKQIKDKFRLWAARRSNEIIVETDYLALRARSGPFHDRIVHVVKMEPGAAVLQGLNLVASRQKTDRLRVLALTGPHSNKRLNALIPIVKKLNLLRANNHLPACELQITFDSSHSLSVEIIKLCEREGIPQPRFLGSIPPDKVGEVLSNADAIVNISRLESFSNNWVEAWAAGIPLISTDADWARASCGDAAIYIDPEVPAEAARIIHETFSCENHMQKIIKAGTKQLNDLATQGRKIDVYFEILKSAEARISQKTEE